MNTPKIIISDYFFRYLLNKGISEDRYYEFSLDKRYSLWEEFSYSYNYRRMMNDLESRVDNWIAELVQVVIGVGTSLIKSKNAAISLNKTIEEQNAAKIAQTIQTQQALNAAIIQQEIEAEKKEKQKRYLIIGGAILLVALVFIGIKLFRK